MPYDPTKPANNAPLSSAEMRSQLTSLNTDIQSRVTQPQLNTEISGAITSAVNTTLPQTSANSNAVATLGQVADGSYNPGQIQMALDKIDELINALRR